MNALDRARVDWDGISLVPCVYLARARRRTRLPAAAAGSLLSLSISDPRPHRLSARARISPPASMVSSQMILTRLFEKRCVARRLGGGSPPKHALFVC
jgi:hypothetical protein